MHGGGPNVSAGVPLPPEYKHEHLDLVEKGCANMQHHIKNVLKYGINVVVGINKFSSDTDAELQIVLRKAKEAGAAEAVIARHWEFGGEGAKELAEAVIRTCEKTNSNNFKFLYPLDKTIKEKIEIIAREMYGAIGVEYSDLANEQIERYTKQGFDKLPICIAKTHVSFLFFIL